MKEAHVELALIILKGNEAGELIPNAMQPLLKKFLWCFNWQIVNQITSLEIDPTIYRNHSKIDAPQSTCLTDVTHQTSGATEVSWRLNVPIIGGWEYRSMGCTNPIMPEKDGMWHIYILIVEPWTRSPSSIASLFHSWMTFWISCMEPPYFPRSISTNSYHHIRMRPNDK